MTSYGHCSSDYLINPMQCLVPKGGKKKALGGMDRMCLLHCSVLRVDVHRCYSETGQVSGMGEELTQYSMSIEIQVSEYICLCMSNSREE